MLSISPSSSIKIKGSCDWISSAFLFALFFNNLFVNSIDEIREMTDYQNVKKGCNTNNPTSHCKNCSYKELTPILEYVGIWNHIYGK